MPALKTGHRVDLVSKDSVYSENIPANFYSVVIPNQGPVHFAESGDILNEKYVFEKDDDFFRLSGQLEQFMSNRDWYRSVGLAHRRGYLLYGPPGTGKTAIAKSLGHEWIKSGGIVVDPTKAFMTDVHETVQFLKESFAHITDSKVMLFVDEIDYLLRNYADRLAPVIDGSWLSSNVGTFVVLGTTNFFNEIPAKFSERPGRFDERFEVRSMTPAFVKLICGKLAISEHETVVVERCRKYATPAILSEIAVRLRFGGKIHAVINSIEEEFKVSGGGKVGFVNKDEEDEEQEPAQPPKAQAKVAGFLK